MLTTRNRADKEKNAVDFAIDLYREPDTFQDIGATMILLGGFLLLTGWLVSELKK
jgi:hypothetical protein